MQTPQTKQIEALINELHAATAEIAAARDTMEAARALLGAPPDPTPGERAALMAFDALRHAESRKADVDDMKRDLCSQWATALGSGHSVSTELGTFSTHDRTAWKPVAEELLQGWDPVAAHKLVSRHTKTSHRLTLAKGRRASANYLATLRR